MTRMNGLLRRALAGLAVGLLGSWGAGALGAADAPCCGEGPLVLAAAGDAAAASGAVDVRSRVRGLQAKPGLNFIHSAGGLSLYGRYADGKFVEYVLLNSQGKPVPSTLSRRLNNTGETVCWQCGVGEDGKTHCWIIPCPVIKGPWSPGGVRAR